MTLRNGKATGTFIFGGALDEYLETENSSKLYVIFVSIPVMLSQYETPI